MDVLQFMWDKVPETLGLAIRSYVAIQWLGYNGTTNLVTSNCIFIPRAIDQTRIL